jgi:hypothetical protein
MNFFKSLLGNKGQENQGNQGGSFQPTAESLNPNKTLDLKKSLMLTKAESTQLLDLRKEEFTLVLRKKGVEGILARIVLILDKSGSARPLYNEGTFQRVVDRLLPIAMNLDDNGELDMYLFSSDNKAFKKLQSITERDFYQYVQREILGKPENNFWGGTEYAPIMREIVQQYGINDPSSIPTFVMFITDGANTDRTATKEILTKAAHYPIFWQFIGLNKNEDEFEFLQALDDLKGRVIDNADFFQLNDIDEIDDDFLYNRLMTEFPSWIQQAKSQGILK